MMSLNEFLGKLPPRQNEELVALLIAGVLFQCVFRAVSMCVPFLCAHANS